jgi:hypothetical protein
MLVAAAVAIWLALVTTNNSHLRRRCFLLDFTHVRNL